MIAQYVPRWDARPAPLNPVEVSPETDGGAGRKDRVGAPVASQLPVPPSPRRISNPRVIT
jgi:hypothetical protein